MGARHCSRLAADHLVATASRLACISRHVSSPGPARWQRLPDRCELGHSWSGIK
jgi:hypothetical protein